MDARGVTRAGVTEDFIGMQLQDPTSAVPNPSILRTAPLQRRSLVLSEAAESGNRLPEPSLEMIAYAASQEQDKADESSSSARGAHKRLYAELSPLPEEVLDNGGTAGSSSGNFTSSSAPNEDTSNDRPRRSTRRNKVARRD